MKQFIAIIGVGVTASFVMFASVIALASSPETGKDIYEENCAACHSENGKGAFPGITPDFTNKKGPLAKSDETLLVNITEGYESEGSQMEMPALGGNDELTEEDIKKVLKYIRGSFEAK